MRTPVTASVFPSFMRMVTELARMLKSPLVMMRSGKPSRLRSAMERLASPVPAA